MCGISGVAWGDLPKDVRRRAVSRMVACLRHRGPDGASVWQHKDVALGHTRLAIIDLSGGKQPMYSESARVCVTYNGEIYNHRALRRDLERCGYTFATDHSDTEVILHGYREWGDSLFTKLDGMYALALHDCERDELLLVRDHIGIKPLYYWHGDDGLLCFASELKALRESKIVPWQLAPENLRSFFCWRAVPGEGTLIDSVRKVPPGAILRFKCGGKRSRCSYYWQPGRGDMRSRLDSLESTLRAEVQSHMESDVPVAVFLSGGVDSSIVAAMAAPLGVAAAYTVGTNGKRDESQYAAAVAERLGLQHKVIRVDGALFERHLEDWFHVNDDPVADPSAVALMILAGAVREDGIKVALAGEGADELFGGYSAYVRYMLAVRLRALIRPVRRVTGWLDPRLPDLLDPEGPVYGGAGQPVTSWVLDELILTGEQSGTSNLRWPVPTDGTLRGAMLVDQRLRLPSDLLARTDRASMACSVEVRVPFLARQVIEYANCMKDTDCVRPWRLETKVQLKKMAARHVGRKVIYRKKVGFDLPLRGWLQGCLREQCVQLIRERMLPWLDYERVRELYARPQSIGRLWGPSVWSWFCLEKWVRQWGPRS